MIRKILIVKPSALGDIAIALPVLASLRKHFPDAKISWLVRSEFAPLLEMTSGLDEIILFDRKGLGKWWCNRKSFVSLWKFFRQLRAGQFDMVIDLQGLFRTALFSWITGSKKRFGLKGARECAGMFYTDHVEYDENCVHLIDYNNRILKAASVTEPVFDFNLHPGRENLEKAEELLADNGCSTDYAVFVIGAAHERKCWPIEKFASLAEKINSEFGSKIVIVGTGSEKEKAKKLTELANADIVDLTGKTNIPVLTALLSKASMVVSNDTGPGHIACAAGADLVMIFGPTNPARIYPYSKPESVAAVNPFGRGIEISSTKPEYAIDNITVEDVYEKVAAQMSSDTGVLK